DEQVRTPTPSAGLIYRARSLPGLALPLARTDLSRYVTLPPKLDPSIGALAEQVLQGETDPRLAAERLVSFLKCENTYSTDLPPNADEDPLAEFLFGRRKGHCEHFATALAVMLRTKGLATRVVTGFYGGERVEDAYVVRAADAHAWVQVWIPN